MNNKDDILKNLKLLAAEHLSNYLQPMDYYIVDKWPLTTNAKIDKKALLNIPICQKNALNAESLIFFNKFASVLHKLLNKDINLDFNKNLFEHGITSSELPKLKYLIDNEYQISFPLHQFFEHQNLRTLILDVENQCKQDKPYINLSDIESKQKFARQQRHARQRRR